MVCAILRRSSGFFGLCRGRGSFFGRDFRPDVGRALIEGYEAVRTLAQDEREALPLLAQGAALRFISSRAQDWIDTPADALVTKKDPMDFVRRLEFYRREGKDVFAA